MRAPSATAPSVPAIDPARTSISRREGRATSDGASGAGVPFLPTFTLDLYPAGEGIGNCRTLEASRARMRRATGNRDRGARVPFEKDAHGKDLSLGGRRGTDPRVLVLPVAVGDRGGYLDRGGWLAPRARRGYTGVQPRARGGRYAADPDAGQRAGCLRRGVLLGLRRHVPPRRRSRRHGG